MDTNSTAPTFGTAWCPECNRRQAIVDQFTEDTGDSRRTVEEYAVTVLACDHTLERTTREYRSPLQQATLPRAYSLPDGFTEEDAVASMRGSW